MSRVDELDGHVFDEFPLLLSGEADRATVGRVSTHLRSCADCKDELVSAVTAHATLMSAARRAPDIATGGRLAYQPAAELDQRQVADLLEQAASQAPPAAVVDLQQVFAQIRREAAETAPSAAGAPTPAEPPVPARAPTAATGASVPTSLDSRRPARWRQLLIAAAAVVVLGGGAAVVTSQLRTDGRAVTVSAFGAGTVNASATVGTGWMKLNASNLPALPTDKYYEVWLVDAQQTGLLALGPLGGDRTGQYALPTSVMNSYSTVQVTVQDNNGSPLPSKVSVLKGTIAG